MASIIERSGRFTARIRRDGFQPVAKTFGSKRDAQAWARAVEADMDAGRYVEPAIAKAAAAAAAAAAERNARTVADALTAYRTQRVPQMKGAQVASDVLAILEASAIASMPLVAVKPIDLAVLRDSWLARGLKPGTVAHRLGLIGGFFTWCADPERAWIDAAPRVKKPEVRDARERTLSAYEQAALLDAAQHERAPWLLPALQLLIQTAMRGGELCAVKVQDVSIATATIRLHKTKNGDARDVPMCPAALKAAGKLLLLAHQRGDRQIAPVTQASLSRAFQRVIERARVGKPSGFLADVRLHDLRHTAATRWASTGALTVFELQRITGHRDVRSLNRYINIQPADVAKKLAAIAA